MEKINEYIDKLGNSSVGEKYESQIEKFKEVLKGVEKFAPDLTKKLNSIVDNRQNYDTPKDMADDLKSEMTGHMDSKVDGVKGMLGGALGGLFGKK